MYRPFAVKLFFILMPCAYVPIPTSRKYLELSTTTRKYRMFPLLVHTLPNIYTVTKTRILFHLLSKVHVTTTQTPPSVIHIWLQNSHTLCQLLSDVQITTTQTPTFTHNTQHS